MKLLFKLLTLGGLSLLLLIALSSIKGITNERKQRLYSVQNNIADSYAREQILVGPVVTLRYRELWIQNTYNKQENRWVDAEQSETRFISVFPKQLTFNSTLQVEERYRGIFKANVYQTSGTIQGTIQFPSASTLTTKPDGRIEWVAATAGVHLSDPRGISKPPKLLWNDQPHTVDAGSQFNESPEGFHAKLSPEEGGFEQTANFRLDLDIHGMQRFQVVPIASDTEVSLQSAWEHPSFIGDFLATSRTVSKEGFTADWYVNGLASSAQQNFDHRNPTGLQTLGVELIDPVNPYPMTERALKYAFLFIFLTFAAFFLFELLQGLQIHPIQYGFVGLAQAMFFLLLLSLSEHISFGFSYLMGTLSCIGIITVYLIGVLGNRSHGIAFGGLLGFLYGSMFGLLQSEDHALMAGSVLLFGLLAGVMVLTRKIDWYELSTIRFVPTSPSK